MTTKNEELAQLKKFRESGVLTDEAYEYAVKQLEIKDSQVGVAGDNTIVEGDIQHGDRFNVNSKRDAAIAKDQGKAFAGGTHYHNYQSVDKSKTDPDTMRNAYLYHLLCDSEILTLKGIDPKAATTNCHTDSRLNLVSVYTALLTHEAEGHSEGIKAMRLEEKRSVSALEVINRNKNVVLLGDPGSGKTTFVNFLTCCMAGEILKKEEININLLTRPLPDDEGKDEKERQKWEHGALLPVRIILRDFAARGLSQEKNRASDLWNFIQAELNKAELCEFAPYLKKELMEKGGILLLDGLDEVPEADNSRVHIRKIVENFIRSFGKCRVMVTSRTYAYQKQDWRIPGLHEVVLAPFTPGQITRFIERWYIHVAELRHENKDEAQGNAELLKRAVFNSKQLKELAQRPLLLTLMASLHSWRGGTLPENREELYSDSVDLLLDWWERPKVVKDKAGNISLAQPSLMEWLKIDRSQIRRLLNELAYNAHFKQPELTGTADIDEGELIQGLWNLCKNPKADIIKLMEFLSDRAGLLLPRGVKVYSFPHRTFQEYLSACYLTDYEYPDHIAKLCREEPNRWREVCLLAGAKAARGSSSSIWSLAEALCYKDIESPDTDETDIWAALLAGQALAETALLDNISPRNQAKFHRVITWLLDIIEGNQLPAVERINAGNALSKLGDPRFNPDKWYLPKEKNMGFVKVPAGKFLMGTTQEDAEKLKSTIPDNLEEDTVKMSKGFIDSEVPQHSVELTEFYIARYPVTVLQFRTFADETEHELDNEWHKWNKGDNHPVVQVTWHDAVKYCDWFNEKLNNKGWHVTLPTEAQWEKSARGINGRIYPWGNKKIEPNRANYGDTGIGTTSPVGCFSQGKNPYNLMDMIGNVWEWCRDYCELDFDKYYIITDTYVESVEDPLCKKGSSRVGRGGSWYFSARHGRSAARHRGVPDDRRSDLGFRLVLLPGQP